MPPQRRPFELQGHRGARGLRPENTLPSFEAALDAGAVSVETDLHLTRDGVVVLCHEPFLDAALFSPPNADAPRPAVADVTLAELRRWRADRNPDPGRFPAQVAEVGLLARQVHRAARPPPLRRAHAGRPVPLRRRLRRGSGRRGRQDGAPARAGGADALRLGVEARPLPPRAHQRRLHRPGARSAGTAHRGGRVGGGRGGAAPPCAVSITAAFACCAPSNRG